MIELKDSRKSETDKMTANLRENLAGKDKELDSLGRELRTKHRQIEKLREDLEKIQSEVARKDKENEEKLQVLTNILPKKSYFIYIIVLFSLTLTLTSCLVADLEAGERCNRQ